MLVNILVVTGLCKMATAHLIHKDHVFIDKPMKWPEARKYCREKYVDLSTFETSWETNRLPIPASQTSEDRNWIGLHLFDGNWTFIDQESLPFERWESSQPDSEGYEQCGAVNKDNNWFDLPCDDIRLPFLCYDWAHKLILVRENKTWEEALMHCRSHHIDLASLPLRSELLKATELSSGAQTSRFWTSLSFLADEWLWLSRSYNKGLRYMQVSRLPMCPAQPFHCGAFSLETKTVISEDCQLKLNFICYGEI